MPYDSLALMTEGLRWMSLKAETGHWSELLDLCFNVTVGSHFVDDFPVWSLQLPHLHVKPIGWFEGNELRGAAGIWSYSIATSAGAVPVSVIGGVVTHPNARGRGIASRLIEELLADARSQGHAATFLWASEKHLYERAGFKDVGAQVRVPIKWIKTQPGAGRIELGWRPELLPMLKTRIGGRLLTDSDFEFYKAHKNVKWFAYIKGDEISAYLALGRGIDMVDVIHEWGGDSLAIVALLHELKVRAPKSQLLIPEYRLSEFKYLDGDGYFEPMAMGVWHSQSFAKIEKELWLWGLDAA